MPIRFDHPEMLWLLLLAVVVVAFGRRSLASMESYRRWVAIGLRLAVVTLAVLILADMQAVRWHTDLTVFAVVDRSESVRRFARPPSVAVGSGETDTDVGEMHTTIEAWVSRWLSDSTADHKPDDRLGLVVYDGQPSVGVLPSTAFDTEASTVVDPVDGTDTAAAIRLSLAMFGPDTGRRLVLISDGNDTAGGDLLAAAREAAAAGVSIDVLPLEYQLENEVVAEGLYAPVEARRDQAVSLRAVLRATRPADGLLQVEHDGELLDLNGSSSGTGTPVRANQWTLEASVGDTGSTPAASNTQTGRYVWVGQVEARLTHVGANRFKMHFEPTQLSGSGVDTSLANNIAWTSTFVHGKGRVLFVARFDSTGREPILADSLRRHGIELDVLPPTAIPIRLDELQNYDAVFLQDIPAELVTPGQQKLIARYVNDLGGGLVMVGGPDSFGAGGWAHSPIDRILPVDCQIPSQTILPSGALVLVLDRSGSMSGGVTGSPYPKQEIANEAAVLALGTLFPQDMVGVVAFDNSPKWVVRLQSNTNPRAVAKKIRSIRPGGGTNIYPALEQAYTALAKLKAQDAAVKHVILLTDGQSQSSQYYEIVGKMAGAGITMSTIGVGDDVNSQLLAQLAQMSGGTYYPVSDPSNLPQVFIKEARTIRKNLIREFSFQPRLVQTGSPITTGLDAIPRLKGFVLTSPKRDPRVLMSIVGPEDEPIFAHWQVGWGRSAAFTSDAVNRWSADWLTWHGYADFWARTARAIARPTASREYDLLATIHGDTLHIRLDAVAPTKSRGRGASFQNFLRVAGSMLGPDGKTTPVRLDQTGPGIYEARVPASVPGGYVVSLFVSDRTQGQFAQSQPRVIFASTSRPAGAELRFFKSNRSRLEQIANLTGGRVLDPRSPTPVSLFDRQAIVASRSIRPLWRQLMFCLLGLFLVDVAVRRIAWDVTAIRRWFGQRVAVVTQVLKPRDVQAAATLSALKHRAAQLDQRLGPGQQTGQDDAAVHRKYDAPPGVSDDQDFAAVIGAAGQPQPEAPPKPIDTTPESQPDTTSRLLDVKRRTQQHRTETDDD